MRRMNRLSVAELKQIVLNPEVVEMHDVTGLFILFYLFLSFKTNSFEFSLFIFYLNIDQFKIVRTRLLSRFTILFISI